MDGKGLPGIPGVSRAFTQEETDDLYQEVRTDVLLQAELQKKKTVMATKAGLQRPGLQGHHQRQGSTEPLESVLTRRLPKPDDATITTFIGTKDGFTFIGTKDGGKTTADDNSAASTNPRVPRNPLHGGDDVAKLGNLNLKNISTSTSSTSVITTPTPSISTTSSLICTPCGTTSSINPVIATDVDTHTITSSIKPVIATDVDTDIKGQPRFVQDASGMTEDEMKQIVKDCFDEMEKADGKHGAIGATGPCAQGFWSDARVAEINRVMQDEKKKPVPGSRRMKFETNIFNYAGSTSSLGSLNMLLEESAGDQLCSVTQVRVRPAMDSGSCDHVIDPDDLPQDCVVVPNTTGHHFRGANNSVIENFGDVETILESELGAISCNWKGAAVSRPLHSVSKVCGPAGGLKNSKQDVLFNNDICVVVPPGIVAEILKRVTPVAQYAREGNLYVGDMVLSSFHRQGPQA